MRIGTDRDRCIGAGMCVLTAPEVFDQDAEDGRVLLLDAEPPDGLQGAARRASFLCPSGAISTTSPDRPAPRPPHRG
ncbi:ferredoxin [Murinocardiopsis flavida]|uniref:Ferredoxin n=1 Tax=Murinocardiopsis flavida TaxID=645275 RepID=A0A2P8DDR3_9ACTN|nr:ferredoxin [Murinocardiopsis flavida]PSK95364.1 ferredoxin [Murinocardiopsis flavida]